ncbi:TPA: DUF551 domain-containing protein [Enterobacter hormaechei subsp. steigerwaltii]|nr:DUF551 domain-containing protein [Enterobacter hormaechei subsp. steigerwaltii]
MITLTKEWLLKTIAELEEERDATPGAVNEDAAMALAAMKLALASLEVEPVAYVDPFAFHNFIVYRAGETDNKRMGREWMWANPDAGLIPVYTAPPAPVSVPDDVMAAMQKVARIRLDLDDFDGDKRGILDCLGDAEESLIEVVNRRAAMLQGAEPVTTAYKLPDGWVACSERMPKKGEEVLCTDQFENYETALYDTGYIPGPPFFATTAGEFHPTHWMPLPAAPQQE